MSVGLFVEKDHPPSSQEMLRALGPAGSLWEKLVQFITDNYQIPGEFSFGGKKYGWNLWVRKSGKTLTSLYPHQDHFIAQVVLGKDQAEQALQLDLGQNVRQVLEGAPQLHDGRWLFIPVHSEEDEQDVEQLLRIKKRPRPGN